MKLHIILFLLFYNILVSSVQASNFKQEELIIKKILTSIKSDNLITIYTDDDKIYKMLQNSNEIYITKDCNKADLVLSKHKLQNNCKKPEILFDYRTYLKTPSAIGVFFWQKDRPTIRFSSQRLKHFGLNVQGELSKFVTSKNH